MTDIHLDYIHDRCTRCLKPYDPDTPDSMYWVLNADETLAVCPDCMTTEERRSQFESDMQLVDEFIAEKGR